MNLDEQLEQWTTEWKIQTKKQLEATDHDICPKCKDQLYFCDCAQRMAQYILELHYGID